jgi:hypothetical protein
LRLATLATLARDLRVVRPSMRSSETERRAAFLAAKCERERSEDGLDERSRASEQQKAVLSGAIGDLEFATVQLKGMIAAAQRGERTDVIALSRDMTDLRLLQDGSKRKMRFIEIEREHYDAQARALNQLIAPKSMDEQHAIVNQLRSDLHAQKATFRRWIRAPQYTRRYRFTSLLEMTGFAERSGRLDMQLMTLKRRENVVKTKIKRLRHQLASFKIRVPQGGSAHSHS